MDFQRNVHVRWKSSKYIRAWPVKFFLNYIIIKLIFYVSTFSLTSLYLLRIESVLPALLGRFLWHRVFGESPVRVRGGIPAERTGQMRTDREKVGKCNWLIFRCLWKRFGVEQKYCLINPKKNHRKNEQMTIKQIFLYKNPFLTQNKTIQVFIILQGGPDVRSNTTGRDWLFANRPAEQYVFCTCFHSPCAPTSRHSRSTVNGTNYVFGCEKLHDWDDWISTG